MPGRLCWTIRPACCPERGPFANWPGVDRSGLGVDDDVLHVRLTVADVVFEPAGELVRGGERDVPRHGYRDKHHEAVSGVQQAQLAGRLLGTGLDELGDAAALCLVAGRAVLVGAGGDRLLQWLEVGADVL